MVKTVINKDLDVPFSINHNIISTRKYNNVFFVTGYKLTDDKVLKFKGNVAYEKLVVSKLKIDLDDKDMLMGYLYEKYFKKLKKMVWLTEYDPSFVSLNKHDDYWWINIYVNGVEPLEIKEEPMFSVEIPGNVMNGEIAIYKIPLVVEKYVDGLKKFEGLEPLITVVGGSIKYNELHCYGFDKAYVLVPYEKAKIKVIGKEYELNEGTYILIHSKPINDM